MTSIPGVARFAAQLYSARAAMWWRGYVRADPVAQLQLRPGREDPYRVYDRIRETGTLVPTPMGNWASASHRICAGVLRDRRFGVRPAGSTAAGPLPADEFDLSLLDMDPPDHTRLRRLATPAFGPGRVAGYRPLVQRTVERLLDVAAAKGSFDLVTDFAAALPIAVITELLGLPDAEVDTLAEHGRVIGSALDGVRSLSHARALLASNIALNAMFERLFELRRREPSDDVVSTLLAAEGDQLASYELVPLCTLLLVAGFETTVNLIGNGTLALLHHPEQWDLLRSDPSLAPQVVEEVLRYDPPVQRTARVAHEELELDGHVVRRDQLVLTLIGGGNRDPEVYAEPDRFDLTRAGRPEHLAFSGGAHYCLGAPLARAEGALAFAGLAERMPGLRLAGRPVRRAGRTIRGPLHVPVSV